MDCETRRGAFRHPLTTFRPDGVPLGTVWQKTSAREKLDTDLSKAQRNQKRDKTRIEKQESFRSIEGLPAGRDVAAACPQTTCVCVSDTESDTYKLFSEPRSVDLASPVHFLIRATQERCIEIGKWLRDVRATDSLSRSQVRVSSRVAKVRITEHKREQSCDAHTADVEIHATTVTLNPPSRFDRRLLPMTVNVVVVEEPNPPQGCQPIHWLLVTTLSIGTLKDVLRVVRKRVTVT